MLSSNAELCVALDSDRIGFLTAVNPHGQPQTSPVWFIREGDELVVYNRPTAARLRSIDTNPRINFNLRGDPAGRAAVLLEGTAAVDASLPPAKDFPGYEDKYRDEIRRLGWTPDSFSEDYSVGIRITVTRIRVWGVDKLNAGVFD